MIIIIIIIIIFMYVYSQNFRFTVTYTINYSTRYVLSSFCEQLCLINAQVQSVGLQIVNEVS